MRAMKDSGIEWIGQIPQEWSTVKVKFTGDYQSGNSITASAIKDSGEYPVYGGNGLRGYTDHFTHNGSHILIGRQGALCGNVHLVNGTFWASEHAVVGKIDDNYDIRYIRYLLDVFNLNRLSTTAAQPGISVEQIANVVIPKPPKKSMQLHIASFLDSKCAEIDALIAAKEKTNALLKERRQSIIYEAVTKGLNPDAPMKDSGIEWIGQIPENWDVVALKRVATPSTGMTPSKANSQYWEGDIPWFSSKDIKSDYLFDSEDHISQQAVEDCGLTIHGENSVVFCARSGILRHTFPVAVLKCKGTINQDLRVLATSATIDPEFLMYYLRGMNNTIVTLYQKVGATVESIEMEWLLYLPVVLPPLEEQKDIARFVVAHCSEIDELIVTNEVSIQKLKEYRQSIIYEAVTGKIEV